MRIRCIHGYFIFEQTSLCQLSDFMNYTGFTLVPKDYYYTFDTLATAPRYSITGKPFINLPAIKTYAGNPWEVFEKNGFVYNFQTGLVVPIQSIVQVTRVEKAGNRYLSPGLILPGSLLQNGDRVKGYDARFSRDRLNWKYSEVEFV